MSKANLDDVCGRYLSSRLSKQTQFSSSSSKKLLNNEYIASEHKRHTILTQKLLFKPYKKNPLEQLRQRYTNIAIPTNLVTTVSINTSTKTPPPPPTTTATTNNNNNQYRNPSSSLMMNWELLKDRGSGLINLGNTCFINASLQCLANTPPLVQWLLSNSHSQHCRLKLQNQFCLFCEVEHIIKLIHSKKSFSSSSNSSNPNNIVRRIKDISKTFKHGRQEDASEFLICLLDKIIDASLRSSQPPERLRPSSGTSYDQLCHSQTILHDLFALVFRSRVVCSRCRYTSDTFEVQYSWIVCVRNHSDLRQSLQQFVCRENLSGANSYRCMKCKQLVPAIKRYTLHKASKILLINLKRFEFGKNSHKLSHLVRYPEHLNLSSYISEENCNDQLLNYRLYAVLVHLGSSMHSGHYYSYVRSPNNRWYRADDTTMTQCDLNQVLTQHGAYILCYIKETATSSSSNNMTNGATTMNKVPYQNGKSNTNEQQSVTTHSKFFTSCQIPVQNMPRQINGHNGNMKSTPSSLTKPTVASSNVESTNGHGTLSNGKPKPIVMGIPKISSISHKPIQLQTTSPSALLNSSTKNNNHSSSSLSSVQSTSSPLKLIIKASTPVNGLVSISNSYKDDDSFEVQQPVKKKQRIEEFPSPIPSSQSASSSSLILMHKKKKLSHNHKRSRHENGRSRSRSPISSPSLLLTTDEQYRKNKKSRHQRRLSSTL